MSPTFSLALISFLAFSLTLLCSAHAAAQEQVLSAFPRSGLKGELIFDAAGNLYGAQVKGGPHGLGAIFELIKGTNGKWTKKILYSFTGNPDGAYPFGPLIFDAAGNLYGTTYEGGSGKCPNGAQNPGCGTVFELVPGAGGQSWTEKQLWAFQSGSDGLNPEGGLLLDAAGNLYGITPLSESSYGTVFVLTPPPAGKNTWSKHTIRNFSPTGADGYDPQGNLVLDGAGNLYATTNGSNVGSKSGALLMFTPGTQDKWGEKILLRYGPQGGPNGLVFDAAGNLYGAGGAGNNWGCGDSRYLSPCGAVFELSPGANGTWTENVLYEFSRTPNAWQPNGKLVFDNAGSLYGTSYEGGTFAYRCDFNAPLGCGTVFKLTPNSGQWTETILHSFGASGDGINPYAGVILDGAGNIYGTTGGSIRLGNGGTVFELTP